MLAGNIPHYCLQTDNSPQYIKHSLLTINNTQHTSDTHSLIEKFWVQEEITNCNSILSPDDSLAEKLFTETAVILSNGTYQVDLPLIDNEAYTSLGTSFGNAKNRFLNQEATLHKNTQLFSQYRDQILEYIELGQAKKVSLTLTDRVNNKKYFVPHLCVNKNTGTTKVRC